MLYVDEYLKLTCPVHNCGGKGRRKEKLESISISYDTAEKTRVAEIVLISVMLSDLFFYHLVHGPLAFHQHLSWLEVFT